MTQEQLTCTKIQEHVGICTKCSKALSFDPIEKSLLKSYSIRNDVLELCTFIVTGVIIIIILHLIVELKKREIN
jgi:hypothetical protein